MIGRLNIERKATIACILIALVAVVECAAVIFKSASQMETLQRNEADYAVTEAVNAFQSEVVAARVQILNMLISGKHIPPATFGETRERVAEAEAKLAGALGETAAGEYGAALVATISGLLDTWYGTVVDPQLTEMTNPYSVDVARLRELDPATGTIWSEINASLGALSALALQSGNESFSAVRQNQQFLMGGAIVGGATVLLVAIGFAIFIRAGVVRPLKNLTRATIALSSHKWDTEVPGQSRSDELGEVARALVTLRDEGREAEENDVAFRAESEAALQRATSMQNAAQHFSTVAAQLLTELESTSGSLSTAAGALTEMAEESHAYAKSVAKAADESGNSVQNVATSIEEMSISVNEISRQVQTATQLTHKTTTASNDAVGQVSGLLEKSQKIHDVLGIINGIASQINLLALNATIESARAGEAGKGFAVVAQQVKELADQTGSATEEITRVINGVSSEIADVVSAIEGIGTSINAVDDNSSAVASAVEEQSAAISDITTNVGDVSSQTLQVADNVKGVEEKVSETNALAEKVQTLSEQLKHNRAKMTDEIETFVQVVTHDAA